MSMNREQSFAIPTKEEWMAALTMRHGEERQKAFSAATVAVCGLGGLGSNIATALARAGIGKLILMDFDCVDITNLHRQQYKITQIGMPKTEAMVQNLREINPYIDTEIHTVRITTENAVALLQEATLYVKRLTIRKRRQCLQPRVGAVPTKVFCGGLRYGGIWGS